jgi:hypothetical protein
MKANESKSIHVTTFTTRRETYPPPGPYNNVQLSQEEDVKYLWLHLDRRLTWHKYISAKTETTRNHPHQNVLVTRTKVKNSLHATNFSYIKQYSNQSGLNGIQLWETASTSNIAIQNVSNRKPCAQIANKMGL